MMRVTGEWNGCELGFSFCIQKYITQIMSVKHIRLNGICQKIKERRKKENHPLKVQLQEY